MQQSIGEVIRQLRRQSSLTQTELGGTHFSKSYVSAVERTKITPSIEALHFFAEQLGLSDDYFIKLRQDIDEKGQLFSTLQPSQGSQLNVQEEFLNLLDILLEGTEQRYLPLTHDMLAFSPEMVATLPPQGQAHYLFLRGLIAQEQNDFPTALHAFEQALAFASTKHQPVILDALGNCHYLFHAYQTALGYHERALRSLEELPNDISSALRLRMELHCGNDYRALSAYQQARIHYEQARQHLNATYDMRTAGELYLGLGYCTYAYAYEQALTKSPLPLQDTEREFQRAISYLLQSRTLYQISGDQMGESTVRLLQAMILLDLCALRRQTRQEQSENAVPPPIINSVSLLEEVQEQCHQVLILWQDAFTDTSERTTELETVIFTALAYLIRAYTQSAAFARMGGFTDTASCERALAAHLCQQVLDASSAPASLRALVQYAIHIPMSNLIYQSLSLPRLPDSGIQEGTRNAIIHVELFFAAGELAEELARAATTYEYAHDCYQQANQFYRIALTTARSIQPDEDHDPGSLLRYYQRCTIVLEERIQSFPESTEEHIRTLLNILKIGLAQSQHPLIQ